MAGPLDHIIQRLHALKTELPQLAAETFREHSRLFVGLAEDMNIRQLEQGRRVDGSFLPDYAASSVARGKPPGPIKLFDTGAFYKGVAGVVTDKYLDLVGRDRKTELLEKKYGDVTGLTPENKQRIIEIARALVRARIKKYLLQK